MKRLYQTLLAQIQKLELPEHYSSKQLAIRFMQAFALEQASSCPRRQFGAILLNHQTNTILSDGYNGAPRGGSRLCGGNHSCERETKGIRSGTYLEIGCHHAEANAILNAASNGISTHGATLLVTGEPCLQCAKLIHHAQLQAVLYLPGQYTQHNGINYLQDHGVQTYPIQLQNDGTTEDQDDAG